MTIVALGITLWQMNAELVRLRPEVRQLRDETGQLTIEDPNKVHAIQIATDYPLAWKWRIYVPANRTVYARQSTHDISKTQFPKSLNSRPLVGPKEYIVTVKIDKQPDGKWRTGISAGSAISFESIPEDALKWLNKGSTGSETLDSVGQTVSIKENSDPLVLLRKRVFYSRGQIPPANEPEETDGLLVWLTEIE